MRRNLRPYIVTLWDRYFHPFLAGKLINFQTELLPRNRVFAKNPVSKNYIGRLLASSVIKIRASKIHSPFCKNSLCRREGFVPDLRLI
jgi:hypothetical protein